MGEVIALDSMMFIYLFESDTRYIDAVESIFESLEQGTTTAVTSVISVIEALSPEKYNQDRTAREYIARFFYELSGLTIIPVDKLIAEKTAELRRKYPRLRTPDAIQLATAIHANASCFLTNDRKLASLNIQDVPLKTL